MNSIVHYSFVVAAAAVWGGGIVAFVHLCVCVCVLFFARTKQTA